MNHRRVLNDPEPETSAGPGPADGRSGDAPDRAGFPRVTSFRTRTGVLKPSRQDAWDRLWATFGRDAGAGPIDVDGWFERTAPTVVEIGCGMGTSTAEMALAEPGVNVIAIDVYKPGLAKLLQLIEENNIANIRIVRGDAVTILEEMIAPASLAGVRVFFPDPWPKKRHHKRRLLKPEMFRLIATRLQPHGVLHVATDHAEYAEFIEESGNSEPMLGSVTWPWPMSSVRPETKFEGRAARVGSAITDLAWGRITE